MSKRKKVLLPDFRLCRANGNLKKRWYVEWYDGKKRQRIFKGINQFDTAKGRELAAKKLIKELKGQYIRKVTRIEDEIWKFIETNKSNWRKKTLEQYKCSAEIFLKFLAGRELTQKLVLEFLNGIKSTRHPSTYNRYLAYVKRLLKAGGYDFYVDDIQRVKAISTPARYFQRHQAERVLKEAEKSEPDLAFFIKFIYYCFIRPGELRQLRVGDILLEDMQIRIPNTISKNRRTQFVVVPEAFQPELECLYDRGPGEYLFPSPRFIDQPVGKNLMYKKHLKIMNKLNFGKGYTLYSWKHTGAVAAAKAGISIKELQLQLRHHSLDETDKYLRQMGVQDLSSLKMKFPGIKKHRVGYIQELLVHSSS